MPTSTVLFDLGNVLASWNVAPRIEEYARRSGLTESEVLERLSTDDFWIETDRGMFSADEMEMRICELLGESFSREELLRLQALAFTVRPEVLAIAKRVSERRPTGILTNNAPLLEEALPIHFPELVDTFDPILFSFQFGHVKPERAIFEAVQAHLGVPANEILLLDDTAGHVAAASASGWDTIHYQSASQLRNSLASRSLIGEAV